MKGGQKDADVELLALTHRTRLFVGIQTQNTRTRRKGQQGTRIERVLLDVKQSRLHYLGNPYRESAWYPGQRE